MAKISNLFVSILICVFMFYLFYQFLLNQNEETTFSSDSILIAEPYEQSENDSKFLKLIQKVSTQKDTYSEWPRYLNFLKNDLQDTLKKNRIFLKNNCLKDMLENGSKLSIETFDLMLEIWSKNNHEQCVYYFKMFNLIYDVKFKQNNLFMSSKLTLKVKELLNNDESLLNFVYNQKLVSVYNKFTNEENVFNTLRPKRPIKKPDIPPNEFYKKTINESKTNCDFCTIDYSAYSKTGRIETEFSYSAANLFPFDGYHELFLPKKHDLLNMNFNEFKDLLSLPSKWFKMVNNKDSDYKYPVVMWDFLFKGGASQIHPHLHGTINSKRYYGMFETIRKGAELYFRETNRNYFNDFTLLHDMLNLTFVHKNSMVIFPLTPKKDYDITIMSNEFNDSIIELIYAVLNTYFYDLDIYPFSLTIYYPKMNKIENYGQIPVYVKILPRGEISSLRSDASTLELMTTFNANLDQFHVRNKMKEFILKRLKNI